MSTLLILVLFLLVNVLLTALFFQVGARWLKAGKPHFFRALGVTIGVWVLAAARYGIESWTDQENAFGNAIAVAALLGQFLVACLLIKGLLKTTLLRSLLVFLIGLAFGILTFAGLYHLEFHPYVFAAYLVPSNSMAPTVVGRHRATECPHCRGMRIELVPSPQDRKSPPNPKGMDGICASCFRPTRIEGAAGAPGREDHVLVDKLLQPRRWDMIAFRVPMDRSVKYLMRLVGLPGETVYIQDGAVWVNGRKAAVPSHLNWLHYLTENDEFRADQGTPEKPWHLGPDEYCVLGDFSARSYDSRFWGALSGSDIEGVVGLRYWPVSRWTVFPRPGVPDSGDLTPAFPDP